jgi:DNA-binding transcriptional LysR family regulator
MQLLNGLDDAEQRIADAKAKPSGTLRVAAHPLAIVSGLSRVLTCYQKHVPSVETEVSVVDLPLNLENSNFDVAIYPSNLIGSANVVSRALLKSQLILAASPAYLERVRLVPAVPDLSQHSVIFVGGHHRMETRILLSRDGETICAGQPRYRYFATEAAAKAMALAGVGIGLLPEDAILNYLHSGRLQRILPAYSLVGEETDLGVHFVHRRLLPRRTREFIDLCVTFYDKSRARGLQEALDVGTNNTDGKGDVCLLPQFSQHFPQKITAIPNHSVPDRDVVHS